MDTERLTELAASTAQLAAAERIATGLFVGFEFCNDAGQRLSEIQRIELVKAALLVFDGFASEFEAHVRIGRALGSFAPDGTRAAPNDAGRTDKAA